VLAAAPPRAAPPPPRAAVESGRPWTPLSPFLPSGATVLGRALLEQGKLEAASAALAPVWAAAERGASPVHRFAVAVDRDRVRAARGEATSALQDLDSIAAEAAPLGYRLTALRARLAHDQILAGRDAERGAEALRGLAADARQAGFGWIASQADAALAPSTGH
jgi:hypothetical protein